MPQFPSFDPWFVLDKVLDASTARILLYGPPGTGKSLTPCLWAKAHDWTFLSVTLTEETPMSELRGHFVSVTERKDRKSTRLNSSHT